MAKQRYINTKFWSDNFISDLNPLDRYLFLYFLTNEHTDICGIYEIPLKTIAYETGLELDMLKKMLKRLDGKIHYIDGWIFIKNFSKHQAVNESVKLGIERSLKNVPKEIMAKISQLRQAVDSLPPASPHPVPYLTKPIPIPIPILNSNLTLTKPNLYSDLKIAGINEVIDIFYKINPSINYGNKTTRGACEWLIKKFGLEETKKMSEAAISVQGVKYAPRATTPYQLKEKLADFKYFFESQKSTRREVFQDE